MLGKLRTTAVTAVAVAAFGLAASAANAAVVTIDANIVTPAATLNAGDIGATDGYVLKSYTGVAFSDVFDINYFVPAAAGSTISSLSALLTNPNPTPGNNLNFGIANLTATWDTGATQVFTDSLGFLNNVATLVANLSFGLHHLTISGLTLSKGGEYSVFISAPSTSDIPTPLPGAIVLFGSALAGIGLMRSRRRSRLPV